MNELNEKQVREVLTRPRGEEEALAPFFYKKVSLAPLEVDKEIVLKFRRSNMLDPKVLKEKYGEDNLLKVFNELEMDKMLSILSHFLTNESKRELLTFKVIDIGDDGKEIEKAYTIEERLKLAMAVDPKGLLEILDLILSIQGFTKEQIEALFQLENAEAETPPTKKAHPEKKKKR